MASKRIGFFITVRLKSTRLAQKALLPLGDKTVIERVIDRAIAVIGKADVVVCTSTNPQDDPLEKIASQMGVKCFRGSEDDVLARFVGAAEKYGYTHIVNETADNPLFSIPHAKKVRDKLMSEDIDFSVVENVPFGAFVYGLNINAVRVVMAFKDYQDTEIWGIYLNRPEIFKVDNVKARGIYNWPDLRMSMDYKADYEFIKRLYEEVPFKKVLSLRDCLLYLKEHQDLLEINKSSVQMGLDPEIRQKILEKITQNRDAILRLKKQIYNQPQLQE